MNITVHAFLSHDDLVILVTDEEKLPVSYAIFSGTTDLTQFGIL